MLGSEQGMSNAIAAVDDISDSDLTPLTETDFSDSDDSDFQIAPRPSKKRRIAKPKAKKKEKAKAAPKKLRAYKGVLKQIWALPLDVTYEIFGHLRPLDLLQLSRTSKSLRRMLMAKSSTSVWMNARANVEGLPDCPFDMTEPDYATLTFETHCHYCYANNVQTIIWEARLRCCKRCGSVMYAHWVALAKGRIPDVLQCIVPSTHEFTTGTVHQHTEKKYSIEHAVLRLDEMNALSEDEKPLWFWNKKKEFDQIVEYSKLCREFMEGRTVRRNHELDDARLLRTEAIISKLVDAGWGEELGKMSMRLLTEHKHLKIPKDLTERAWQKIEPDMISFMEDVRAKRIVKEKNKTMTTRCNLMKDMYANFIVSQPLHSILPGVADFAMMPHFKAILENPDLDTPVSAEDFEVAEEELLKFAETWREEKDKALLEILRQSSLGPSASKDVLLRATTLFNCKTCSVPISYPRILVHHCNFTRNVEVPDPSNIFERLRAEPWNLGGDRISFHEAAYKRAKYVLRALNMDTETSFEEMNEENAFVECFCALCYRPGSIRTFARWNRMVEHTPRYSSARISRPYGAVDARRTALVKKLEALELAKLRRDHDWDDYSHRSYCCMVCRARDTRQATEKHLIHKHATPNPVFGTDYTYHVDAKIRLRAPFVTLKVAPKQPAKTPEENATAATATTFTSTGIPMQGGNGAGDGLSTVPVTASPSLDGIVAQQVDADTDVNAQTDNGAATQGSDESNSSTPSSGAAESPLEEPTSNEGPEST